MDLNKLLSLNELARADATRYPKRREAFSRLTAETGRHFTGIIGPRGVGKTVLLRQIAASQSDSFYLSLDGSAGEGLFETARLLRERYKIKLLLLDEVHALPDYAKALKEIYDFLDLRVIFTSSMALALYDSADDLSRRVQLFALHPFSFREYLFFARDIALPALTLEDLASGRWMAEHLRHEHRFESYLKGGLFPLGLEEPDVLPLLANVRQKILQQDIPIVAGLPPAEVAALEKTLAFIGRSPVDGINYSSVSRNVGVTKYKAEEYLRLLERAFVLHLVFPAGTNVMREPKVLMGLPYRLLYREYGEALGALREDFVAETLRRNAISFHYLKSTRGAKTPDFLLEGPNGIVLEVGGRSKGRRQFKGITAGRKLILAHGAEPGKGRCPLSLLGFLGG